MSLHSIHPPSDADRTSPRPGEAGFRSGSASIATNGGSAATSSVAIAQTDTLALMAHDMRAALTVASGWARTLLRHGPELDEPDRRLAVEAILRHTEHLLRFAEDLVEMTRSEDGRIKLQLEPLDLVKLVKDTVADARKDYPDTRIIFTAPEDPLWVMADPDRLGRVVANLLSNAAKASTSGADVEVEATGVLDGVAFRVSDHGPGMPSEVRDHLFEKFGPRRDDGVAGLGLGLYLSRVIIEAHGGRIWGMQEADGAFFGFLLRRIGRINPPMKR